MKDVKDAIWEARSEWKDIGRALNISDGDINAINGRNAGECLNAVLSKWRHTGNATIANILEAMEDTAVGRVDIANHIRDVCKWNMTAKVVA